MLRRLPLALLLGIGCADAKAAALTCAEARNPKLVIQRCYAGNLHRGRYVGDVACFPFSEPKRLKGTWRVGLESSVFEPGMARRKTWLEMRNMPTIVTQSMQGDFPRSFAVELIGRRSLCPGNFGHLGMSSHEIVVDRLITFRPLVQ